MADDFETLTKYLDAYYSILYSTAFKKCKNMVLRHMIIRNIIKLDEMRERLKRGENL